jgi:PhzF family phenazine biosynthesis protein
MGLSETAFVSKSRVADFKLEFFTPSSQIHFCGHATVAAFGYLNQIRRFPKCILTVEIADTILQVRIKGQLILMEQKMPIFEEINLDLDRILSSVGIGSDQLLDGVTPTIVSTGNRFLIIGVRSREILQRLQPDFNLITDISKKLRAIGYYLFSLDTDDDQHHASARMFAPAYGIDEEAATGMAAGALGGYLRENDYIDASTILIEQGNFMQPPSPSLLIVNFEPGDAGTTRLMVGGHAKLLQFLP